jgi:hypothetical protein
MASDGCWNWLAKITPPLRICCFESAVDSDLWSDLHQAHSARHIQGCRPLRTQTCAAHFACLIEPLETLRLVRVEERQRNALRWNRDLLVRGRAIDRRVIPQGKPEGAIALLEEKMLHVRCRAGDFELQVARIKLCGAGSESVAIRFLTAMNAGFGELSVRISP